MGIGFAPPEVFLAEIQKVKTLTSKPFGCNLITAVPYSEQLLQIILKENVPVVELEGPSTLPDILSSYANKLKAAGIIIIGKDACVKEALVYEKAGVDIISVKGADGGGHIYGFKGTFSFIPQVVDAVKLPVINSSGIGDGRGFANDLSEKVLKAERQYDKEEAAKIIQELCSGSLRKAAVDGDIEKEGTVVVGQNVGMLTQRQGAKEIMEELIHDYTSILLKADQYA